MKIATITCHNVYNYGASLQAYALQRYLSQEGHDVEIIDYKPYYLNSRYNWRHIPAESRLYPYKRLRRDTMYLFSAQKPENIQNDRPET